MVCDQLQFFQNENLESELKMVDESLLDQKTSQSPSVSNQLFS